MKKSTKVILGTAAGLTAANLVHAALYTPKKTDVGQREAENVNEERMIRNVSRAIQFRTISNSDPSKTDWDEFDRFHAFLDEAYPLIAEHLEKKRSAEPISFTAGKEPIPICSRSRFCRIRMSCLFHRGRRATGSIHRMRASTTESLSGDAARWI